MTEIEDDITGASPVVRYSAKELFAQINHKLDVVLELAQSKASQHDLEALELRVEGHGTRIQTLEDRGSNRLEALKAFTWVIATGIAALAMLTGLGLLIFTVIHNR